LIFINVEIDFYHLGNKIDFYDRGKLIFTTLEIDFTTTEN